MRTAFVRLVARALLALLALLGTLGASAGCATYKGQLVRSHEAFDRNEHERARALLEDLEPNVDRLETSEQARYAYLRGMSNQGLGRLAEARHWLALARARDEASPGLLPAEWKARTATSIADLDEAMAEGGYEALLKTR